MTTPAVSKHSQGDKKKVIGGGEGSTGPAKE
jgi:hypothetical protein